MRCSGDVQNAKVGWYKYTPDLEKPARCHGFRPGPLLSSSSLLSLKKEADKLGGNKIFGSFSRETNSFVRKIMASFALLIVQTAVKRIDIFLDNATEQFEESA